MSLVFPVRPGGHVAGPVAKHVISFAALMQARLLVTALPLATVITCLATCLRES